MSYLDCSSQETEQHRYQVCVSTSPSLEDGWAGIQTGVVLKNCATQVAFTGAFGIRRRTR